MVVNQSCTPIRPCLIQSTLKHIHVSRYKSMCTLNRGAAGPNPNLSFQGKQTSSRYKANGTLEETDQHWAQMLPTHMYCCICISLHIYY